MSLRSRVQKLDRALDPTQIVACWLVEAQTSGSLATTGVDQGGAQGDVITRLCTDAAQAVRETMKSRPGHLMEEAIAEAVAAVLHRVFLVFVLHDHLENEHCIDTLELELLTVTLTCLEHGGHPETEVAAWGERCRRLLHETTTWQAAIALLGHRYFAGHRPVFPDQMATLHATASACTGLLERARANLTAMNANVNLSPVDLATMQHLGEGDAALAATSIAERAAEDADLFTGTRSGVFHLRRLVQPWGG